MLRHPPPATSRSELPRSQELPAPYTTAPSVLHHLSSIHWTSLLSISPREEKEEAVQAREGGTQGINTVSEDGANRCGCCAVVIRAIPVPSWIRGWFAPIAETPLAIPNAFLVRVAILHSFLIDLSLFAGPTGGSESRLLLDRTGETVVTTCDRFELFCVFAFFFVSSKGFLLGFQFCFTTSGCFFLLRKRAALILGSECFLMSSLEIGGDAREKRKISLGSLFSCFCVLVFPDHLGGAKNLTVKSILWRGSAYRFLPCPFIA